MFLSFCSDAAAVFRVAGDSSLSANHLSVFNLKILPNVRSSICQPQETVASCGPERKSVPSVLRRKTVLLPVLSSADSKQRNLEGTETFFMEKRLSHALGG